MSRKIESLNSQTFEQRVDVGLAIPNEWKSVPKIVLIIIHWQNWILKQDDWLDKLIFFSNSQTYLNTISLTHQNILNLIKWARDNNVEIIWSQKVSDFELLSPTKQEHYKNRQIDLDFVIGSIGADFYGDLIPQDADLVIAATNFSACDDITSLIKHLVSQKVTRVILTGAFLETCIANTAAAILPANIDVNIVGASVLTGFGQDLKMEKQKVENYYAVEFLANIVDLEAQLQNLKQQTNS